MESFNQLKRFTLDENSTSLHLCVVVSKCLTSLCSLEQHNRHMLLDTCIILYGQNNGSQFITYLLDKLIVSLCWSDRDIAFKQLILPEFAQCTYHTILLKSISKKLKLKELKFSRRNANINDYLVKMVPSFQNHLNSKGESFDYVVQTNIYHALKIFMHFKRDIREYGSIELVKLVETFDMFYDTVLKWILLNIKSNEPNDLRFVSRLLKRVTQIEFTKEKEIKHETEFCYQCLNAFISRVHPVWLADFDVCGLPHSNGIPKESCGVDNVVVVVVVDKCIGSCLMLSLLSLLLMSCSLMDNDGIICNYKLLFFYAYNIINIYVP